MTAMEILQLMIGASMITSGAVGIAMGVKGYLRHRRDYEYWARETQKANAELQAYISRFLQRIPMTRSSMGGKATMVPAHMTSMYKIDGYEDVQPQRFKVLTEYRADLQMRCPESIHIANVMTYHEEDLELRWEIVAVDKRNGQIHHMFFKSDTLPADEIEAKINLIGS